LIEDLTVRNAFAAIYGAAIYAYLGCASTLTIRDVEIKQNFDGGIIVRENSSPTIQDCWMTANAAKEGGGLAIDGNCNPVVTGCWITGNEAPSGAGLFVRGYSTLQISNCIINDNFVNLANGAGGGVTLNASTMTMSNCVINDNISSSSGGGFAISESIASITGCDIVGNRTTAAYGPGGGIMVDFNSDVTVENCLIARNEVQGTEPLSDGGGVRASFAIQLTLRRCTIAANTAPSNSLGGGVSAFWCTPTIEKCIISHSTAGKGLLCDEEGSFNVSCTDVFGNAGGDALCGTDGGNNFSQNPLYCDLASNNFYLQAASPCLPGQHPNGAGACGGSRIGAYGQGCWPLDVEETVPAASLLGGRPNPFRSTTEIGFTLPRAGRASVRVFDPAGRGVRTLIDRLLPAGEHREVWDGADQAGRPLPSGVYFYQLLIDGEKQTQRLVLTR
jgi:hypothetical protein